MMNHILGLWAPGALEVLVILVVIGIPIVVIVVFLKLLLRNKNENIRLRLEVGKLADELEKVRKQKSDERDNTINESD
jgi:hypothetical protein